MSANGEPYYARVDALWRDTGTHVLVLPRDQAAREQARGEVQVLGGGGAALWRLLGEPARVETLNRAFGQDADSTPDVAEVAACLDQLVDLGVLTVRAEP